MPGIEDELIQALRQSFDLELPELVIKEKILAALAIRIEQMLRGNPDQLFSMLYRLDIAEKQIKQAMQDTETLPIKIAALIYERQLEKINSRKQYKKDKPGDDLAW